MILHHTIFPQFVPRYGACIFAIQHNFCVTFAQFPIRRKGSTSNSHRDNCYPDGEGHKCHPLTPHAMFRRSIARSIGYCNTVSETDRSMRLHLISASTHCSCHPGISLSQRLIGLRVASHFCVHALLLSAWHLAVSETDRSTRCISLLHPRTAPVSLASRCLRD